MVPLDEQLTDTEKKAGKPAKKAAAQVPQQSVTTITLPDEPATTTADVQPVALLAITKAAKEELTLEQKRQKMLDTLARARAIRAEQVASGQVPAKAKPAQAPQSAKVDRLEQLISQVDLMLTRLTDLCAVLESKVAA
jgi:hypothetical protein